jgi:hypothetical protein
MDAKKYVGENGRISCEFIFDEYNGNNYQSDLKNWIAYQERRTEENPEDLSYKFLDLKHYPIIPYQTFKDEVVRLFGMCLTQMIKNDSQLVKGDKLNIQIKLLSVKASEDYFNYDEDSSNPEVACFTGPGGWFLQHLVSQWIYLKRIDYRNVERFFTERIRLHYGYQEKEYSFANKYEKNFKGLPGIAHTYCLKYLYASVFYLKEDGLKDFIVKTRDFGAFEIRPNAIEAYSSHIAHLAELTSKYAKTYYESYLGEGNVTAESETSIGRVICTIIAMHISKTQGRNYTVVVKSQEFKNTDITSFDALFASQYAQKIIIKDFHPKVITETIDTLKNIDQPIIFLKVYEEACKSLGVSNKNIALTATQFYSLVRKAISTAEVYYASKMTEKGFDGTVMKS